MSVQNLLIPNTNKKNINIFVNDANISGALSVNDITVEGLLTVNNPINAIGSFKVQVDGTDKFEVTDTRIRALNGTGYFIGSQEVIDPLRAAEFTSMIIDQTTFDNNGIVINSGNNDLLFQANAKIDLNVVVGATPTDVMCIDEDGMELKDIPIFYNQSVNSLKMIRLRRNQSALNNFAGLAFGCDATAGTLKSSIFHLDDGSGNGRGTLNFALATTTNPQSVDETDIKFTMDHDDTFDITDSGGAYHINNLSVLNATTLGTGVINSNLSTIQSGLGISNQVNLQYNSGSGALTIPVSAKKYKEQIIDLNKKYDCMTLLDEIQPKYFKYKGSNRYDLGFIADDFDEAGINEVCAYDKQGEIQSLRYEYLTAILWQQNKDLKKRLEELERKVYSKLEA